MRAPIDVVVTRLGEYTIAQSKLMSQKSFLPDTPGEPFPDPHLMHGSMLTTRGRTSAQQYHDTRAYSRHAVGDGTEFFALQRTLCTYDAQRKLWVSPIDASVVPPLPSLAKNLASVLFANT